MCYTRGLYVKIKNVANVSRFKSASSKEPVAKSQYFLQIIDIRFALKSHECHNATSFPLCHILPRIRIDEVINFGVTRKNLSRSVVLEESEE